MRLVGAIVLVASCGPSSAIEVVVDMPADPQLAIDSVKIYIGVGPRANASGHDELLVPQGYGYPEAPAGLYFDRERELESDTIAIAAGATEARWVFQPGTHDVLSVIAIGRANGELRVAGGFVEEAMRDSTVVERHVGLVAASAPADPMRGAAVAHEWGPEVGARACAQYKDDALSMYVVDKADRDCDGLVADQECRPDVWRGYIREKSRSELTCLRSDPTAPGTCVLGAKGCNENPNAVACSVPSTTCADPDICLRCAAPSNGGDPLACVAGLGNVGSTATRIECSFFFDQVGPCGTTAPLLDAFPRIDAMCDPSQEYVFYLPDTGEWKNSQLERGALKFVADKPSLSCHFALSWVNAAVPATTPELVLAIANGPLANGRSVALPISVSIRPTTECNVVKTECKIVNPRVPEASLVKCLTSPLVEPW